MTTVYEAQKASREGIGVELREDYIARACGGLLMLPNSDEFSELGPQGLDKPPLRE
jgi:hypothetical protein